MQLVQCAWCLRLKNSDGTTQPAPLPEKIFTDSQGNTISHGICDPCAETFISDSEGWLPSPIKETD